jgi:hypothetical protein
VLLEHKVVKVKMPHEEGPLIILVCRDFPWLLLVRRSRELQHCDEILSKSGSLIDVVG